MSAACPNSAENLADTPALLPLEDWMLEPGTLQDFVDFLLGKGESVSAFQRLETGDTL